MTAPDRSLVPDARRRQRWLVIGAIAAAVVLIAAVAIVLTDGGDDDGVSAESAVASTSSTSRTTTTLRFDAPPLQPLGTGATTTSASSTTTAPPSTTTTTSTPPVTSPPPSARPGPTIESSGGKHQALRVALAEAETRWSEQDRSGGYVFRTQRRCFCPATDNEISVDGAGAVSGQRNRAGARENDPPTVDDVFAAIAGAVAADADEIVVSFDRELGFPVDVDIDFDARVADDEQGRRIRWLVLKPTT